MQGYGKYTIYRRKLLYIEPCERILAIILAITSLHHRHYHHIAITITQLHYHVVEYSSHYSSHHFTSLSPSLSHRHHYI